MVPGAQRKQTDWPEAFENVPDAHVVQRVESNVGATVPGRQREHSVWPEADVYWPGMQEEQLLPAVALYMPGTHAKHVACAMTVRLRPHSSTASERLEREEPISVYS